MKTRDIKTTDSADIAEENQTTKKVVPPLSPSPQPTRQRVSRSSQKTIPQQPAEVSLATSEQSPISAAERQERTYHAEEYNRPAQQHVPAHSNNSSYEKQTQGYTRRP